MLTPREKMPLSRACLWILLSTLMISGPVLMGWLYYLQAKEKRLQDMQYRIAALVQSHPQQEGLKTAYLAELLELSIDRPANLYQFNLKEGERKLLACPLIKKASIQKIRPGTLYVHYDMRMPLAYLGDYANTALDAEGYLFPFRPFFTPKKLPLLYLGLQGREMQWGSCLDKEASFQLGFAILEALKEVQMDPLFLKQIDLADADADSYGKRQIIVILENQLTKQQWLLRLGTESYQQNLKHFFSLKPVLDQSTFNQAKHLIIDLRIPRLAFIKQDP